MHNDKSHVSHRSMAGDLLSERKYGCALALWLNDSFPQEEAARVNVATAISRMNEDISALLEFHERWLKAPNEDTEDNFVRCAEEINVPLLRDYKMALKPSEDTRRFGKWEMRWTYSEASAISYYDAGQLYLHERETGMNASKAIRCLIHLAEEGSMDRMRRCKRCRKWLYAKFRHQQFCSAKCQESHYKNSDAWRAHRRESMRNNRATKKKQEQGWIKASHTSPSRSQTGRSG